MITQIPEHKIHFFNIESANWYDPTTEEIPLENVQLTEYKNGDIIELQQQDFIYLIKQFLLADKLFKDYQFAEESFSLIENQVLRRPIEIVGDPVFYSTDNKKFHVKQGNLGDCWFIVALVHLQNHKDLFNFIVNPNTQNFDDDSYAGIFHFRFWQGGIWVDVVIDDRLAFNTQDKKLVYASSGFNNEFWPALVEKAYAKLLYRSYQRLDGGHSGVSMRDFTGGIIETYIVKRSANESFIILRDSIVKTSMISCDVYDEDGITKLALSTTDGKWMGGINIKEAKDSDIFGFFPQYRMLTTKPDKGKETCDVLVGLSIKHRYDLAHENRAVSKPLKYMEYIPIYPLRRSGQLGVRVNLKPHTTYYIIPFTADTFKGPTFFLQLLSKHDIILEEYDRDIDLPNIEHKFDIIKSAYIQDSDHQLFLNMAFQNDQTIDFKRLYNILRHESFSLNQNCHIIHQLDDSIIPELDLLSDLDDFVPKNILSIASLTKITLLCEEIFERFELPGFRGYSHHSFINRALEKSGYIINANIFNCIYSFCVEENGTVNINDFILIVLNLKSRIGSYYCEEFNAKLTQSLIAMKYGNLDDIFFHQFVQAVVDITQIFGKTQQTTTKKEGQNLNEIYNEMFRRHWKKKQERKNSIDKKREADPAWDEEMD
ncbi:uncharacterized protein LOC122849315 [Aphidius gifuensis]|uniref:uncharacterized protein LOC122849315 n=1 Tax=Aphidius gifuensis TaxID=684658 RepID=UPI001CDD79A5|nr:uncharacterized protein LOC122849315 [Aphidius gifuensis]